MIEAPDTIITGIAQELAGKNGVTVSFLRLPPLLLRSVLAAHIRSRRGGEAEEAAAGEGGGRLGEGGR